MSNISETETDTETIFSDTSSEGNEGVVPADIFSDTSSSTEDEGVVPAAEDQDEDEDEEEENTNWRMITFKISRTTVVKTFRVNLNWRLKHFIDRMKLACMLSIGTANVEFVQTMQNREGVASEDAEAFTTEDDSTRVGERFENELNVNQLVFYIRILPIQTPADVHTTGRDILSLFPDFPQVLHCQVCFVENGHAFEVVRASQQCVHRTCGDCFRENFCVICRG